MVPAPEPRYVAAHRSWQTYFASRGRVTTTRHWRAAVSMTLISVALHLTLIGSALWSGTGVRPQNSDKQGAGATAVGSDEDAAMTLVLLDNLDATPAKDTPLTQLASRGLPMRDVPVRILSPDPLPGINFGDMDEDSATPPPVAPDPMRHALLFGSYIDQVDARINRAWRRPRANIGDTTFRCSVRISQGRRGEIVEIELQNCNGDARWQKSLVQAIQRASPLPSPPDPSLFADALTMSFTALAYEPGASPQDYESPAITDAKPAWRRDSRSSPVPLWTAASGGMPTNIGRGRVNGPSETWPKAPSLPTPRTPETLDVAAAPKGAAVAVAVPRP